jgi:type I restriction enzyme S subunit
MNNKNEVDSSGWQLRKFKDVVQFPPKISLEKGRSYSFIPMEQINSGYKYVSANQEKIWNGSGGAKFENGDTLFARITPCLQNGKISQAKDLKDGTGFGSTEYFIFRGLNNISNSDFIYYLSQTYEFRSYAVGSMVGASGRQRADATFVGNYEFLLPPLPTQKRIASILSAYDDLIENNLKRIKLLEEVAQRTYEEWFVKFRINGEQLTIDENTGLPEGWERKKLNEVANIISGFPFKSSDYIENGCYKIVTIKNVQDGYFVPNTTDSLIEIPSKVKKEQQLKTGDIILSLTGNVGRTCLVHGDNYLLNQRVAKLIAKENFSFGFVYATMRSEKMLTTLENISNGAAQQNLSPINMGNVDVVCPDENTLSKFNDISDSSIKMICKLYLQNQKLKESRDILLPKLMNGTLNIES